MGYYSFYKIIKDIIRTLFGSRAFRIILIVAIVFVILINLQLTSFGSYTLNYDGHDFTVTDDWINNYPYYIFYNMKMGSKYLTGSFICSNSPLTITPVYRNNSTTLIDYYLVESTDLSGIKGLGTSNLQWTIDNCNTQVTLNDISSFQLYESSGVNIFYSTYNVYTSSGDLLHESDIYTIPFFTPSDSEIQSLNFDKLFVETGDYGTDDPLYVHILEITQTVQDGSNTVYYYGDNIIRLDNTSSYYKQYLDSDYYYYSIPKYKLSLKPEKSYLLLLSSSSENINNSVGLIDSSYNDNYFQVVEINTSNLITSQDVTNDNIQNINDNINNMNNDITNTLTDSSVTTDIDLPTDNTQDITKNGIDNIFDNIYNAFTSGEVTDIVFPIPFTNKNITLSGNYTYNMLNNNASWLIMFIHAFWWYIISRFIISDISRKITKIKSGNLESIENTNIKEEML